MSSPSLKKWLNRLMNMKMFENDVKMYGIQTDWCPLKPLPEFENDVKTYGIQTMMTGNITNMTFENDVKMHGIQTQSGQ